jgi:hypothetical protein
MNQRELLHTVYKCRNRRCHKRDVEFTAMPIAGAVQATGRRVHCDGCGEVVWFVRNVYKDDASCPQQS